MNRTKTALTFVGFAVVLHSVHLLCAVLVAKGWNPMGADQIASAYGYVNPLVVWPKFACLGGAALMFWPEMRKFFRNQLWGPYS